MRDSRLGSLACGDRVAVWVEEWVAQQAGDTLVLTLGELMLLGVGDAVPVLGGIARVLGEIELVEAVGTCQLEGALSACFGEAQGSRLGESLALQLTL